MNHTCLNVDLPSMCELCIIKKKMGHKKTSTKYRKKSKNKKQKKKQKSNLIHSYFSYIQHRVGFLSIHKTVLTFL